MLQSLLAERFSLKVHYEMRNVPAYALRVGKKPLLRPGDASGETRCKAQTEADSVTILVGPGATISYSCRNMSMDQLVNSSGVFRSANLAAPILNETGLSGTWNFDLTYSIRSSMGLLGDEGARVPLTEAVEKQLGLKLEPSQLPMRMLIIDSVNRTATPNPPGVAEALPPIVFPSEFEVASLKPAEPVEGVRRARSEMQPGGRYICDGATLRSLIDRAFNVDYSEQIQNIPAFAQDDRYDITAKVTLPPEFAYLNDRELIAPLIRSLLVQRFKMTYHTETREVTAYDLVAGKPKMNRADPDTRTYCSFPLIGPEGSPPGTMQIQCRNATMEQFADQLRYVGQGIVWPVKDKTGMEGGWDFTLLYMREGVIAASSIRSDDSGSTGPKTSDPTGGLTIFQAIEKQLGLKLEKVKRGENVIVIDHLEQKPTAN